MGVSTGLLGRLWNSRCWLEPPLIAGVNSHMFQASQRSTWFAALLLLVLVPVAYADTPKHIFGIYTRLTPTCGPSAAESAEPPAGCRTVFEDRLEVAPSIDLNSSSANTVYVSFGLHSDIERNQSCLFSGHASWSHGRLLLDQSEKPIAPECRLTLSFSKGTARLSDPQHKCQSSLCNGPGKLDGAMFKKSRDRVQ